jgi:tRNA pseudouridine38-40 synthase
VTRVRLLVAYDGEPFAGFARNVGVVTVAGELESHLERVLRVPVSLTGAGRTDRGVHAWGQVVTFDIPTATVVDLESLRRSLNGLGAGRMVVREATLVGDEVDARFSAAWRRYRYSVLNEPVPDPFLGRVTWWVDAKLDLVAMNDACRWVVGEHDFASFCRRAKPPPGGDAPSLVRRVMAADWTEHRTDGGQRLLRFEITASSFCHQMVRSVVGTLVSVGRGRLAPGDVAAVVEQRDRAACPDVAPPHGLCLWEVGY